MENTLVRSKNCSECGLQMLWTQNAWPPEGQSEAAYRCANGHVLDPEITRQCPACGVHDTDRGERVGGKDQFRCLRCGQTFEFPRGA